MLIAAAAGPLELVALGLAGVAVIVAVGSALAAYGSRRVLQALDEQAEEPAAR